MGFEQSSRTFPELGVIEGHHDLSHHMGDQAKIALVQKIDRHHVQQLAYFLGRLREVREGEGTLLDGSMVVYGSAMSDGNKHLCTDLPTVLAGRGGGTLGPGRHLRYADVPTFIERFAPNVTRGGIFLASRNPRAVGEVVRFEVYLAGQKLVFSGEGKITWVKAFDPAAPQRAHGMGVQFLFIDPESRSVLDELLARKGPSNKPSAASSASLPALKNPMVSGAPASATGVKSRPPAEAFEEFDAGVEESLVRRAVERARLLANRTDDLEALLAAEPEEPATLAAALAELPRLLSGRRNTGLYRTVGDLLPSDASASKPTGEDDRQTKE
jgi:uncharacterized protein (TIGR02266 family)